MYSPRLSGDINKVLSLLLQPDEEHFLNLNKSLCRRRMRYKSQNV